MRDPFTWSLPLGRILGFPVRMHVIFPIFVLGVVLRVAFQKDIEPFLWVDALFLMMMLTLCVLLHELGHCFAARAVDGDAHDVLLWPLGGLASLELPHTWRAHFVAAAGGPAVNFALCLVTGAVLVASSFWPPLYPGWDLFRPVLAHTGDGTLYGSKYGLGDAVAFKNEKNEDVETSPDLTPEDGSTDYRNVKTGEVVHSRRVARADLDKRADDHAVVLKGTAIRARPFELAGWQAQLSRFFWINWMLGLLNVVVVGYPLDGGQMFQALAWSRYGYRPAMTMAVFAGFFFMFVIFVFAVVLNDVLPVGLAAFIYFSCYQKWRELEHGGEESMFGYDFSQGYTSLERDQPPPKKKPGFIKRWLQARQARKLQREQDQREADERRMDELLEKVQREGLQALTDEEKRFLKRVGDRFRNRN